MKINPVIAGTIVAVVTISAIAISRNAQYQEEKRTAWLEAAPLKSSCALKAPYQRLDTLSSIKAEANPDNAGYRAEAEQARKKADLLSAQCKKVRDYEIKYNDVIERSAY